MKRSFASVVVTAATTWLLPCRETLAWVAPPNLGHKTKNDLTFSSVFSLLQRQAQQGDAADAGSDASPSSLEGKTVYKRTFYRFPPQEDDSDGEPSSSLFEVPNPIVIEERLRYQVLPDNPPDVVSPIGPRTLILRQGQVEPGKIGDVLCTVNVAGSGRHGGVQPSWYSTYATALYLAANPSTFLSGSVLQLGCGVDHDLGLATLLACLGTTALEQQQGSDSEQSAANTGDADDDILTVPTKRSALPEQLQQLTLSVGGGDGDDATQQLDRIMAQLQGVGVPPEQAVVQEVEWRRPQAAIQRRAMGASGPAGKEYHTVIGSNLPYYTVPEAKELARTVAHCLEPVGPYFTTTNLRGVPVPRFCHVTSAEGRSDAVERQLIKFLRDGCRMTVDGGTSSTNAFDMEAISFVIQTIETLDEPTPDAEESALDPLVLEVQEFRTLPYNVLTAQHHVEYAGGGTGEYFFPLETGQFDAATGGFTSLERDPRAGGGGGGSWPGQ